MQADFNENLFEEPGYYTAEFISGLNQSIREAKQGKTRRIQSLTDCLEIKEDDALLSVVMDREQQRETPVSHARAWKCTCAKGSPSV